MNVRSVVFLREVVNANRQNKQTDKRWIKHNLPGGDNNQQFENHSITLIAKVIINEIIF